MGYISWLFPFACTKGLLLAKRALWEILGNVCKEHEIVQSQLKNGKQPYVYCKKTWLRAQICHEDDKSNTLWYQTNFPVANQVREDTLTKEDTLPKLCVQLKSQMVNNHKLSGHAS